MKIASAVLVACAIMSPMAMAQNAATTAPSTNNASTAAAPVSASGQWRASKLVGVDIYNEQNEKVGAINDVILDSSGKVDGVVVGVGGFLGMGEHDVLLTMDKIKFSNETNKTTTGSTSSGSKQWYPDKGTISATKDQLKAMPEFKY